LHNSRHQESPPEDFCQIDAMNVDYYLNKVKPLIDGDQIEYIGEVDFADTEDKMKDVLDKIDLLGHLFGNV
jgi:hypothetical protein